MKQLQFDEYDDIVGRIYLVSLNPPDQGILGGSMTTILIVAGGGLGATAVIAGLFLRSRRTSAVAQPPAPI